MNTTISKENSLYASANLEGETLAGKWLVIEPISLPAVATGGCFSVSYKVKNIETHELAFLKVADMKRLGDANDVMIEMQKLSEEFNFEVNVFKQCLLASKVIDIYDSGTHKIHGLPPILDTASYMVFELAVGDIRTAQENLTQESDKFSVLHSVAHALEQIHSLGIAHLDLKPSNVMLFDQNNTKIGDMGCAGIKGEKTPRGEFKKPGDPSYAPPECQFSLKSFDKLSGFERKKAIDLYLLGSLLFFNLTGMSAIASLYQNMPINSVGLEEDYIFELAFINSLHSLRNEITHLPLATQNHIISIASELCNPDPIKRGKCKRFNKLICQYNMRRYVSKFDNLRKRLA